MMEDLRQSREWAKYLEHLGWETAGVFYVRKLPLIGALIKIQRPSVIPSAGEVDAVAKKYKALFVKLEPAYGRIKPACRQGRDAPLQFSADNWPLLPSRTIWVDLTPSEDEILARFSKDARYSIRKAQKLGVEVNISQDLEAFYKLFHETGKRKKFWVPPFADLSRKVKSFEKKSVLILASYQSKVVAGALILFHDGVAYYHHAASGLEGRRLFAPYLVVDEAIRLAKRRECHTFDLEGVYDPRYKIYRRWKNISIFKGKFGGREIEYPGSFVRYYNPLIKTLFKLGAFLLQ